jgi:hypothetical protein
MPAGIGGLRLVDRTVCPCECVSVCVRVFECECACVCDVRACVRCGCVCGHVRMCAPLCVCERRKRTSGNRAVASLVLQPLQHRHRRAQMPRASCSGTGLTAATSAAGLGSPPPHLPRDLAHSAHIGNSDTMPLSTHQRSSHTAAPRRPHHRRSSRRRVARCCNMCRRIGRGARIRGGNKGAHKPWLGAARTEGGDERVVPEDVVRPIQRAEGRAPVPKSSLPRGRGHSQHNDAHGQTEAEGTACTEPSPGADVSPVPA